MSNGLAHDLRYALRAIARRPAFAAGVVLTLALGIGANAAIFSLVRTVVLKPLPYQDPDRLVHIYETRPKGARFAWGETKGYILVRPGTLHAWREQSSAFETIEAFRWRAKTLSGGDRAESVWSNEVTDGFFATAGVAAALGRTLHRDDYAAGVPRAVVLSDRLWRTRFGGEAAIVGRTLQIDGSAVPVVGVMPPGFYPTRYQTADMWLPVLVRARPSGRPPHLELHHPGPAQAGRALRAGPPRDGRDLGPPHGGLSGRLRQHGRGTGAGGGRDRRRAPAAVLHAVGSRWSGAAGRLRERGEPDARQVHRTRTGVRRPAALGARRARLVRQMLAESVLLAGVGGVLGLVVARVSVPLALALLPPENAVPRIHEVTIDWAVFAFTCGVSVIVGVLFGLAPALRVSQAALQDSLKGMGRSTSLGRRAKALGSLLVTAEIALSLFLLIGAGLLLRSFLRLQSVESGFDTARVLAMELTVPSHRYGVYQVGGANPPRARLYRDLAREATSVPGVETAAVTALLPLKHGPNPWGISIEGRGAPVDDERGGAARTLRTGLNHHGSISIERVTPKYFATLGVPLVRGRLLDGRDAPGAPLVTLVNETFVQKFFPAEDPIGRRITADMTSYFPTLTIVGVVADNKMHGLDREPYPLLYWSIEQFPSINASLVIRSMAAPGSVAEAVRGMIARVDSDLAVKNVTTMDAVVAESMWRQRFAAFLLGVFATVAFLLATAGIYAVISYSVSQRTQEVGVRIAFGATPREILALIVGHGFRLTVAGVLVGIALSLTFRGLVASQLVGISATDPLTIVAVSGALTLVALAACTVPAIRALQIDPVDAIRQA